MKKKAASHVKIELSAVKYKRKTKEKIAELNLEKDYALSAKDNAEAAKRVIEIDREITALKAEMQTKLPALKEEDKRLVLAEKQRRAEIKAAEKAEKQANKTTE